MEKFNNELNKIINKTCKALDKLSEENDMDIKIFSGIKQKDGSWNTGTASDSIKKWINLISIKVLLICYVLFNIVISSTEITPGKKDGL